MADRPIWINLLLAGLFLLAVPCSAARAGDQVVTSAMLAPLDTRGFPRITATLDVRDAQGNFVHGLQAFQVRVLEDEQPIPLAELEELHPGAQLVMALNPSRPFAIRDGQGVSRYDRLIQALQSWALGQESAAGENVLDDYSLLITDHPEVLHLADPVEWFTALESYQADFRATDARLDVLMRAMEVATDVLPRPGMGRMILFVTPPPEGDFSAGLQAIVARAKQQRVRIFVWMIASPEMFNSQGASQLEELATQTGGTLFAYSGTEPVPNLEDLLKPLRSVYRLAYDSRVNTSGAHQVVAEILLEGFEASEGSDSTSPASASLGVISSPQVFEVNILPPNLVLSGIPGEITRESRGGSQEGKLVWIPEEQTLDVAVEFPDGYPRPVISLTLYVDGMPIAVHKEPPFDNLSWDLSRFTEDGNHTLRVEAVDSLGLRGSSQELPVRVSIRYTPQSFLAVLSRRGILIAALAVIFSSAVLVVVLLLGGRIHPQKIGQETGPLRGSGGWFGRSRRKFYSDPVTQPVPGASAQGDFENSSANMNAEVKTQPSSRQPAGWRHRLHWHSRRIEPDVHASLTHLVESEEITVPTPIPLTAEEVSFGRDPSQATILLEDPSVDPLHARLRMTDGIYRISDEGSVAGTWVNYTPVSREGVILEHGDLIHIGRVGFRFLIRKPIRIRKPVVNREGPSS